MDEKQKEPKAKGALLVPLALIINGLRNVDWTAQSGLTGEELQMIRRGVLASHWYPRPLMEKMAMAVFTVAGAGKTESAYQFGYGLLAENLLKLYRGLKETTAEERLIKFALLWNGTWFNTGTAKSRPTPTGGLTTITDENGIPCQICFVPMMRGAVMRVMEANGLKNGQVSIDEEPLVNKQKLTTMTIHMTWDK